jgi:hypothetical protein
MVCDAPRGGVVDGFSRARFADIARRSAPSVGFADSSRGAPSVGFADSSPMKGEQEIGSSSPFMGEVADRRSDGGGRRRASLR